MSPSLIKASHIEPAVKINIRQDTSSHAIVHHLPFKRAIILEFIIELCDKAAHSPTGLYSKRVTSSIDKL